MANNQKPQMSPEILDDGVAVCRQECEAWSKETVKTDEGVEVKIKCALKSGEDSEVHPRPVCSPYANLLLVTNEKLATVVKTLSDQKEEEAEKFTAQIDRLLADAKYMKTSGVEVRGKMVKLSKDLVEANGTIEDLRGDVEKLEIKQREAWEELKNVQSFRRSKKRHGERLEKSVAEVEKLKAKVDALSESNNRLVREDVSKSNIIRDLEKKIVGLTARNVGPEKAEKPAQVEVQ